MDSSSDDFTLASSPRHPTGDVPGGEIPGEDPFRQGMWLTASAWLPPSCCPRTAPAGGPARLARVGQGGVLD